MFDPRTDFNLLLCKNRLPRVGKSCDRYAIQVTLSNRRIWVVELSLSEGVRVGADRDRTLRDWLTLFGVSPH